LIFCDKERKRELNKSRLIIDITTVNKESSL